MAPTVPASMIIRKNDNVITLNFQQTPKVQIEKTIIPSLIVTNAFKNRSLGLTAVQFVITLAGAPPLAYQKEIPEDSELAIQIKSELQNLEKQIMVSNESDLNTLIRILSPLYEKVNKIPSLRKYWNIFTDCIIARRDILSIEWEIEQRKKVHQKIYEEHLASKWKIAPSIMRSPKLQVVNNRNGSSNTQ